MPREPRSFRADAVVIKHRDQGEAARMLTIFTRQRGKVQAIAKGVRKPQSRKGGHVQPFTHVNLQLAVGKNWFIVTQAEAIDTFDKMRGNLELVAYASYLLELIDKFTYEEESNTPLYRLLVQSFRRLNRGDDPQQVLRYYEVRLLDYLGFRPELKRCLVSGEEIIAQDQYFSASLGGAIAQEHGKGLKGAVPISLRALKYIRHFQRSNYFNATKAQIAPQVNQEMETVLQYYITYLLERGLNTPKFLRNIKNALPQIEEEDDIE